MSGSFPVQVLLQIFRAQAPLFARRWQIRALIALFFAFPAYPAEIDSITNRQQPLRDSTGPLAYRLNESLREGIRKANLADDVCDQEALYDSVRESLASPFIGHLIAARLNDDVTLDRRHVPREQSIYRDLGWLQNPSVHLKDLSAVIRVQDSILGVDKFGHFFVEGWHYFEKAVLDEEGIEGAMEWGEFTERTYFGNYTTGVYAYADLVANFEGMRFWMRLLGQEIDPLTQEKFRSHPHVACQRRYWIFGEREWRLVNRFKLDDYVSPVWDEAVNCPQYRTPEIAARIRVRIDALAAATGADYHCPVLPEACVAAANRYGIYAKRLLHPSCLAVAASMPEAALLPE